MKFVRCAFLAVLMGVSLSGCALLESFYQKPEGGGPSTAEMVQSVARSLPYGELIAWAIGAVGAGVGVTKHLTNKNTKNDLVALQAKHDALIAAGKKDDDGDGEEDPTPPSAA